MAYFPGFPPSPDPQAIAPYDPANVRVLTGKVARAIFGPTYNFTEPTVATLSEDQLKDLTADTIAKLIFYTAGLWPYQLAVVARDSNGMPYEYMIQAGGNNIALPIADETLVVLQASLDWFFFEFKDKKVSEKIADEGQQWEYTLSASVLAAQYKQLVADRDRALAIISERYQYLVDYVSFIAQRDALTSAMVEWWVQPGLTMPSGQEIFPAIAAFGG